MKCATSAACVALLLVAAPSARADELVFNVLQESAAFRKSDVVSADVVRTEAGQPAIRIRLTAAAAARFGALTGRAVRKQMQIVVGDRIVSSPTVMEAITGGEIMLSGSMTAEDARAIADKLK